MERTKSKTEDGTVMFRKVGGGTAVLIINGKKHRIKRGQTFRALPSEVPDAFKDNIVAVNAKEAAAVKKKAETPEIEAKEYFVKHKGHGWYDVINSEGKVQNEQNLRKAQAEEFKNSLS